jgi:uncharacterized membrane protein YhhN
VATLALLAFAVLAVTDWVAVSRGSRELEYVAKPAALVALLLYAAWGGPPPTLIAALALSLLGDVLLMVPGDLFVAGLSAFLLAHLAYIASFHVALPARVLWLLVILVGSSPVAVRLMRAIQGNTLRAAVAIYSLVLSLMVASALASGRATAAVGALLFFGSDMLIAWNRFVRPVARAEPVIMMTYHLGQLGLAVALRSA